MSDFIQESEVNEVLNKRKGRFTPELGNFYKVEVVNSGSFKHAKLVSIDYRSGFPCLCDVIVREAISIDGKIASPAKLEKRRFGYFGISEDGKSRLMNISDEDKAGIGVLSDIDSFNKRSWTNLLEQQDCSFFILMPFVVFAWVSALFANAYIASNPTIPYYLNSLCASNFFLSFTLPSVCMFLAATGRTFLLKVCVLVILLLNVSASLLAIISGKIDLNGIFSSSIFFFACFMLALLFCADRHGLRIVRNRIFTIGSFSKFVTEDGKSVVITNKFGDDDDFPMEGYVVICPEIRNGDTVVKEAERLALKWSYSGHPRGYVEGGVGFNNYTLYNAPEDAKAVLDLFDKQYGVKAESGAERATEKAGIGRRYV